jgi:hypothetical protein
MKSIWNAQTGVAVLAVATLLLVNSSGSGQRPNAPVCHGHGKSGRL